MGNFSSLLRVRNEKFKWKKQYWTQCSNLTPQLDGLLPDPCDGGGVGVSFSLSLPTSDAIVLSVTAGWMSCFRLTFKPRETRVTRFKPDGVFIPCIP